MKTKSGNYPIMPMQINEDEYSTGLTKREYFAIKIMQGFYSNSENGRLTTERIIELSVQAADLLIKELDKQESE